MAKFLVGLILSAFACWLIFPVGTNQAKTLTIQKLESDGICSLNRTLVSSTGSAAYWSDPYSDPSTLRRSSDVTSTQIAVARADYYDIYRFNEPYTAEPLAWSRDGKKLFVRVDHLEIGEFDVTTLQYKFLFSLDDEMKDVNISVSYPDNIHRLNSQYILEKVKQLKDDRDAKRFWVDLGKKISYLRLSGRTRQFENFDGPIDETLSFGARKVRPFGQDNVLYANMMSEQLTGRKIVEPYLNSETAGIDGFIGIEGNVTNLEFQDVMPKQGIVFDANRHGDFISILALGASGTNQSHILNTKTKQKTLIEFCNKSIYYKSRRSDINIVVQHVYGRDPIAGDVDFIGYLYKSASAGAMNRDLAIYLHGGPASSVRDDPFPRPVEELIKKGKDVLLVEYAGSSISPDSIHALASRGLPAIESSMRSVANWIEREGRGYQKVSVVSVSFGSVPAILLREYLLDKIESSLYITPLLALKDPDKTVEGTTTSERNQEIFENLVFGSPQRRDKFSRDLAAKVRQVSFDKRDFFVFAKNDRKSLPDEISGKNVMVYQLARTDHAFAPQSAELWEWYWGNVAVSRRN